MEPIGADRRRGNVSPDWNKTRGDVWIPLEEAGVFRGGIDYVLVTPPDGVGQPRLCMVKDQEVVKEGPLAIDLVEERATSLGHCLHWEPVGTQLWGFCSICHEEVHLAWDENEIPWVTGSPLVTRCSGEQLPCGKEKLENEGVRKKKREAIILTNALLI